MLTKRRIWLDSALALAAILPAIGGCGGNKMDGFSNEDWDRITAIAPMSTKMPDNPFDTKGTDESMARFGQRIFFDKRGAEAITADGPSGKAPYTPIDPATGKPAVDANGKPVVVPGDVGKVSCATCHGSQYLVDARLQYPVSHGRAWLTHNTPTMANLGYFNRVLWTGQFDSLREHGAGAMGGNSTTLAQIHYIRTYHIDEYNSLFPDTPLDPAAIDDTTRFPLTGNAKAAATVNGKTTMSADGVLEKMTKDDQWTVYRFRGNMGIVFEAHPRMLTTPNAPFEKYVRDQDSTALSESAKNGLRLFIGKASCIDCHNGPALTDNQFHNIGVPTPTEFPPGSGVTPAQDRGRGGALLNSLNNQLMRLRTNDALLVTAGFGMQDQVPIFGGAGQYSDDSTRGRQVVQDLENASCIQRSVDVMDITNACQALFYPGAPGDDTKTPPVAAKPADGRLAVCVTANTDTGVCMKYDAAYEGSFRTPMLLNVANTAPYFHTGLAPTLRDVVNHYNKGGGPDGSYAGTKSVRLRPLGLTDNEVGDLVAFLESLTGDAPDPNWMCDRSLARAASGTPSVTGGACAAEIP